MKKKRMILSPNRDKMRLNIRKMKLTLILLFLVCVSFGNSFSQVRLSVHFEKADIHDVLQTIENESDYIFLYKDQIFNFSQRISAYFSDAGIEEVLNEFCAQTNTTYEIRNRQIILKGKLGSASSVQQSKTISGKVTDSSGSPLPGVTVVVKGTSHGIITDSDGNYSLKNVPENATLIFSFVGMHTQEFQVSGKSVINVFLQEETIGLEEVVAIGYGTMKKSDLTGSLSSVKGDDLNAFPTTFVSQSIQGKAAGVQVVQSTGAPGATMQIRIRGANSIKGSNAPLWIIDGFPGDEKLLNASDIENIEVLKDASATAIYGSRGANGVIIVTTKHGKAGETRVTCDFSYSLQTLRKKLDIMNAEEYATFYNIQQMNDNGAEYFSQDEIAGFGKGTDWQDLIFRTAPVQNHSVTVTGGNKKTQFSVGANYFNQDGIIRNSDYRKISMRANLNHEISDKLNISYNIILARLDNNKKNSSTSSRGGSLISAILCAPPTLEPYDEEGDYKMLSEAYTFSSNNQMNPLAYINEVSDNSYSNNVMTNLALTYTPVKGLSVKVSGNITNTDARTDGYTTTKYPNSSGDASISTSQTLHINSDNIVSYNTKINDVHSLSITGAFTYEDYTYKYLNASGTGFLSDVSETYDIGSAGNVNTPSSSYYEWTLLSYLGRLNYSYKNKYMVTASLRADGSSRYSKGDKWGYFPSGALAWRISDEGFMKEIESVSSLKLRLGYGMTGSTAIDPYYTLDMLSSGKTVFGNELYTYYAPGTRLPNGLKWESTVQKDIGLDLGLFNEKIQFTVDYYVKNTKNLLNTVQLPSSLGYTATVQNIGKIRNKGLELQVTTDLIDNIFKWNVSANIAFNRNKVIKLYNGQDIDGSTYGLTIVEDHPNLIREGKPLSVFYGYQVAGYDDEGAFTYKDNNDDGEITEEDKTFIGDPNPDFIYGVTSTMSWKNFDLSLFVQGSHGNDIYSFSMMCQTLDYGYGLNTLKEVLDNHWTPETPNAKYPNISKNTSTLMSDRFVYDGSYVKLKNIELAYNIPVGKLGIRWLEKGQIFISGQNLITITKYPWWDPEVNSSGGDTSVNQGIDLYTYPTTKGFTFGARLTF